MGKIIAVFAVLFVSVLAVTWYLSGFGSSILPRASDPVMKSIKDRGILIVGMDLTYPPMEYEDESGSPVGFDVDLAREIAKKIGVPLEVKNISFDALFASVVDGTVDIGISSISITKERSERMLFSQPYLDAGQTLVVLRSNSTIQTVEDIRGKNIAALIDSTSLIEAKKYSDSSHITVYTGSADRITPRLLDGSIDGLIVDYVVASDLVKKNLQLRVVGKPFTSEFYGVASKKGNDALMRTINQVIDDLKRNGVLDRMMHTWME